MTLDQPPVVRVREIDEFRRLPVNRPCRNRRAFPGRTGEGEVLFTCNLLSGHAKTSETGHEERGRIRNKDGKVTTYTVMWWDEPTQEVWRTHDHPNA
jgi:hypothetical protein